MAHLMVDGGSGVTSEVASQTRWRSWANRSLLAFCGGIALGAAGIAIGVAGNEPLGATVVGVATVSFLTGLVLSIIAMVRYARAAAPEKDGGWLAAFVVLLPMLGGAVFSFFGGVLTLWMTFGFARGRQLRRRGKVLLPPVGEGNGWAQVPLSISAPAELREALATRWRENGRTEHASVAAFARLTLDLIALGAPPPLIEAANRDALDEIRHAELCFSVARGLDGRAESPGPFPAAQHAGGLPRSRTAALAHLAVTSLVDGALHEGVSARVIARLAKRCKDPAVVDVLRELAADEGRHAAHGWDVVEWCLSEGGAPVAHALRGASRALPESIDSDLPAAARGGAWEIHGIHGQALEAAEHAAARRHVVQHVLEMTSEA